MNYQELLKWGEGFLEEQAVADAVTDAWYLLSWVFGFDRVHFLMHRQEKISEDKKTLEECFRSCICRRAKGCPVQYIMGEAAFMGMVFKVSPAVLIPRQDTELLAETALELIRLDRLQGRVPGKQTYELLDLCTGSGCIGLSLAALEENVRVQITDISAKALEIAGENVRRLDLEDKVSVLQGDLFEAVTGPFDMIVSNPPYIPSGELPGLMREVRDHEPWLALDGSEDGLHFYRRIAKEAGSYLRQGGRLLLEIGYDQGETVPLLLKAAGFAKVQMLRDLAGNCRVVTAVKA